MMRFTPAGLVMASVFAVNSVAADPTSPADSDSTGVFRAWSLERTYADEDTVRVPVFMFNQEVEVSARRMSLEEIIETCVDAEHNKYDNIDDMQFTITEKAIQYFGDADDPRTKREIDEEIVRVYRKQPDHGRIVRLADRNYVLESNGDGELVKQDKDDDLEAKVEVNVTETREELADLPFFFEDLDDYRFKIIERVDLDERVLYNISFKPRSEFKALPTGEFWLDTTDFQIFHANLSWTKNVPVPLLLRGIDFFSIEKKRVDGYWVYDRIAGRVQLRRIPFAPIPRTIEIQVTFDDYAINQGIPDDVFTP